jgi:hypothetical protein
MSEIVLYVPFENKDKVKSSGCKWNQDLKCWTATIGLLKKNPYLQKYIKKPKKIFYDVPFELKDEFKCLGGKFDWELKKWYIFNNQITKKLDIFSKIEDSDEDESEEELKELEELKEIPKVTKCYNSNDVCFLKLINNK